VAAAAELARGLGEAYKRSIGSAPSPAQGVEHVRQLRAVLSAGTYTPGGKIEPFWFRRASGQAYRARAAGLEGFLYSKLEAQRPGQEPLDLAQVDDYFQYLDDLLAACDWTAGLRREFGKLRGSAEAPEQKSRKLDAMLIAALKQYQTELRVADASNWARGSAIYGLSAVAHARSSPDRDFFGSLSDQELQRIKAESFADGIWIRDIFAPAAAGTGWRIKPELGGEEAFKKLVRRAHAAGLKVGVDELPDSAATRRMITDWGVDALHRAPAAAADEDTAYQLRLIRPSLAVFDEAGGYSAPRADSNGVYNKSDQDLSLGQVGLRDALASRDSVRIRAALENVAFRAWQRGGPGLVNSLGAHSSGAAAALITLLLRPVLARYSQEQDVFHRFMFARSAEYRDLFEHGAMDVLDPAEDTPLVAYSASAVSGQSRRTILAAANFSDRKAGGRFRFQAALEDFGAFKPAADKDYILRDLADMKNGQPAVYERSGQELLEKGLYLELRGGGVHLFEIEEVPAA
jgi:hypothetical protein